MTDISSYYNEGAVRSVDIAQSFQKRKRSSNAQLPVAISNLADIAEANLIYL